jgi:signal transduction histidine kinase
MMAGFALIIIAMVALNGSLLYELQRVTDSLSLTLGTNVLSVDVARELQSLLDDEERHAQQFLVSRDSVYYALFVESTRRVTIGTDSLVSVLDDGVQRAALVRVQRTNEWLFAALSARGSILFAERPPDRAIATISDSIQSMRGVLDAVIRWNQTAIVTRMHADEQRAGKAFEFAIVLTLGTIGITILVALLIARTIISPIRALQAGAARVARGSFQPVNVRSHDETADLAIAFNDMSEQLRRLNEYKAEMMQRITHELRTPLQSLQSIYYLLSEQTAGPINDKQRKYVELLRSNVDRITEFTNQFLDLAKIEAGRMELQRKSMDLRALVLIAVENARVTAGQHGIPVVFEAEESPVVDVDPDKMGQVMANLLSNAVKYTPEGGSVTVRLGSDPHGVWVSVSDTGVGIDPEDIPHLFTKFYQAKNVGKARSKGTGIGLALVKAIVEKHGGTVRVHSVPEKGTTFTVEIPIQGTQALVSGTKERKVS